VPRLCEFYLGICHTTEQKARKNLSQVKKNISQSIEKPQSEYSKTSVRLNNVLFLLNQCMPDRKILFRICLWLEMLRNEPRTQMQYHSLCFGWASGEPVGFWVGLWWATRFLGGPSCFYRKIQNILTNNVKHNAAEM
jgi:hypothetical protein